MFQWSEKEHVLLKSQTNTNLPKKFFINSEPEIQFGGIILKYPLQRTVVLAVLERNAQ